MKLATLGNGPEIFHTLQGEGASIGCPAVFIRTSRCNLHCHWCDTDHTWNFTGTPWNHEKDADPAYRKHDKAAVTTVLTPEETADRLVQALTRHHCARVVITGGEPLLQQDELAAMIDHLHATMPAVAFELETNGTIAPSPAMETRIHQFNCSPKLANSGMPETLRIRHEALSALARLPHCWFKFVLTHHDDLTEIRALMDRFDIPAGRIILMPEGRDPAALDAKAGWLADACKSAGFRFGDRLHVRLWGDRRGV